MIWFTTFETMAFNLVLFKSKIPKVFPFESIKLIRYTSIKIKSTLEYK